MEHLNLQLVFAFLQQHCARKIELILANTFDWNDIRLLLVLQREGSLRATARQLKVDVSTISRRLSAAETALKTRLFIRTTSGYQATVAGLTFLESAQSISGRIQQMLDSTQNSAQSISGTVRITSVDFIFSLWLVKHIASFKDQYPQLSLELLNDNRDLSFSQSEADIAIRLARPERDAALFMRKVGELGWAVYGHAEHPPLSAAEWSQHAWLSYTDDLAHVPEMRWLQQLKTSQPAVLQSSHLETLIHACKHGVGLALLPCMLANEAGLKQLSDGPVVFREIWLLSHRQTSQLARFETVYNWLLEQFSSSAQLLRGVSSSLHQRL